MMRKWQCKEVVFQACTTLNNSISTGVTAAPRLALNTLWMANNTQWRYEFINFPCKCIALVHTALSQMHYLYTFDSVSQLHIVNVHSKFNGNVSAALAANDNQALAVLGFLIEVSKTTFIISRGKRKP